MAVKKKYKRSLLVLIVFILLFSYLGAQKYNFPDKEEIDKRINYLERVINSPLNENSDLFTISYENSEWMLFSLSFSTFALTNIALTDSTLKFRATEIIDLAIDKALNDTVSSYYANNSFSNEEKLNNGSVLYYGHLNLMLGCYRLLSDDNKYDLLNDSLSKILNKRYNESPFMCLESYPGMIWIPDNTVALSSLKLHSVNTGSNYSNTCNKWVNYAKENFIDERTGLLCSMISPDSGNIIEEPRGSMAGWSILFVYRFDKDFAKQLYENYKQKFSNNLIIFRLFKERYQNFESRKYGDIDSGPIVLGYSIPANAFAFGDAVSMNDLRTAQKLLRMIKIGRKLIESDTEIRYELNFVDMQISPMAEAILLYFETMTDWF